MNYIQESLAMQQRLWMALLEGGETEERQEESLSPGEGTVSAVPPASRRSAAAPTVEMVKRSDGGDVETPAAAARGQEAAQAAPVLRQPVAVFPETGEARWEEESGAAGDRGSTAGAAEDLSRELERDARRYDGGFPLY